MLAFAFVSEACASGEEREFIQRVASEFAVTLDSHLTRQRYLRERDRLQLLFDLTNALVSKLAPDELFAAMIEQLHRTIDFDLAAVMLCDRITGELRVGGTWCDPALGLRVKRTSVRPEGLPAAEAIATGLPVRTDGVDFDRFTSPLDRLWVEAGFRSTCSLPLATRNAVLGTLELGRIDGRGFRDEDVGLLVQISRQVAIALENSLAYAELAEMKEKLAVEKRYLEDEIRSDRDVGEMLGESPCSRPFSRISGCRAHRATVLSSGDRHRYELVARAIHQQSLRVGTVSSRPTELPSPPASGKRAVRARKASPGPARRVGRFELADKGPCSDEIGRSLRVAVKLLPPGAGVRRLGGNAPTADVRIIAASNRDLTMVDAGGFLATSTTACVFPSRCSLAGA